MATKRLLFFGLGWGLALGCWAQPDSSYWELRYRVDVSGSGYTAPYAQMLPPTDTLRLFLPKAQVRTVTRYGQPWYLSNLATGDWWLVNDTARQIEHRQLPDLGPDALQTATPSFRLLPFNPARDTVAGFRCRLYEATADAPDFGGQMRIRVWLAPQLRMKGTVCTDTTSTAGISDYLLGSGCYGYYLRRELQLMSLNITVDTRCTQAIPLLWVPDSADSPFSLPTGYDMVPFDPYRE